MEQDFKAIQARLDGPPTSQVRNINIDTHIGQAPQRPYALLEDAMASVVGGWASLEALQASLKSAPEPQGLPKGAPDPNAVEGGEGGMFRYVVSQDTRDRVVVDDQIHETLRFERRGVSLTQQGARAASENGTPTDYWNGYTWLREGYKPERDFPVMMQAAATAGADRELTFTVPVSATEAATLRHEVARIESARPPLPVERSSTRATSRSKED
jgi:hypothetical protein